MITTKDVCKEREKRYDVEKERCKAKAKNEKELDKGQDNGERKGRDEKVRGKKTEK